jgi:hypothetical protein
MSSNNGAEPDPEPRQRVVRVPGSRRARLTPAPGAIGEPDVREGDGDAVVTASRDNPTGERGPNDERLRREVPPHY